MSLVPQDDSTAREVLWLCLLRLQHLSTINVATDTFGLGLVVTVSAAAADENACSNTMTPALARESLMSIRRISQCRGVVLALAILTGCRASSGGACDFVYLDPLLSITEVKDAVTKAAIPSVRLRNLQWNGHDIDDARFFTEVGAPVQGVTPSGGELLCNVACGFANQPGVFGLTVHLDGYRDTTLNIDANYSKSENTCPIRVSQGVILRLELKPL